MSANKVKVRAVAGRVARTSPRGEFIPHDQYITVDKTPYMNRLINVHGDVEVKPDTPAPEAKPAPAPKKEV